MNAILPSAMPPLKAAPPPLAGAATLPAAVTERMVKPAVSGRLYQEQPEPELPVFAIRLPGFSPGEREARRTWLRIPAAEPVERVLQARALSERLYVRQPEPEMPEFAMRLPEPAIPRGAADDVWKALPEAAPAERISAARSAAVVAFPGFSALQPVMGCLALTELPVPAPKEKSHGIPEPQAAQPVPRTAGPLRTVEMVVPAAHQPVHGGYFPDGPEGAVETMPDVESARSMATPVSGTVPAAPPLRMPLFGGGPTPNQGLPTAPFVTEVARPAAEKPAPRPIPRTPVPTVTVRPPKQEKPILPAAMPMAEMMPLEYFCSRGSRVAAHGMGWIIPTMAVAAPRFTAPLSVERIEPLPAPAPQKKKRPAFAEIFTLPEAKGRSRVIRDLSKMIAACLVIGAMLWLGGSYLRSNHDSGAGATLTADYTPGAHGIPAAGSGGVLTRVRSAIVNRAETHLADGFEGGMAAWGSAKGSWAPGWSHNPDGYVTPGSLALFQPTLRYTDYRLDFFGEIESKSIDWAVRATDDANYYAMKFAAEGPGPRAVVNMIHYPVVAGKKGAPVSTPVNVMVHEHTPYHVAVVVHGDTVTTSIEGEPVDTFVDHSLARGGVGFFADAGEKARLYWIKVSKNEDWLGRVCAFLSGGGSATAELWPPTDRTQSSPIPGTPMPGRQLVLAAGFGLMRRNAFSRISDHRRFSLWRS